MDKSAVITTGNKQYHVKVGDVIEIEKMLVTGSAIVFDQVLLLIDGDQVSIGTPLVANTKVYGTLESEKKGDKIQVFRYKSKSRYRKLKGHRQPYLQVKIDSIGEPPKKVAPPKSSSSTPNKVAPKKPAVKRVASKKPAVKK